jgi:murein DD-endopeptidase MepM/ murein hydrolase activator NlpD
LEQDKKVVAEKVVEEPVNEIIAVGTKEIPPKQASGSFIMPTSGTITSPFGQRGGEFHKGLDIAVPTGTNIVAADGGTVVFAGWDSGGYGNLIKIDHGNGFETYYGHSSKLYVKVGQKVAKGELIAAVGSTGNSTGPHVHFEIHKNGVAINPSDYV